MANPTALALLRLIERRGTRPGERIPAEPALAVELGVSRPVLREALAVLEALGLLAARKGSGRVLMLFDFGDALAALAGYAPAGGRWLLDLLAVRQALESSLLSVAAATLTEDDFQDLEEVSAEMERKAEAGAYFGAEDQRFHALLYRNLNNEVLQGILAFFWQVYDQLGTGDLAHSQRLDETAAHHRRILVALRAGDIRRAEHHLNAHFYDTGFALSRHAENL